jgi:hypothetical protein
MILDSLLIFSRLLVIKPTTCLHIKANDIPTASLRISAGGQTAKTTNVCDPWSFMIKIKVYRLYETEKHNPQSSIFISPQAITFQGKTH